MISDNFEKKYCIKSVVFCAAFFFLPLHSMDTKKMVKSKGEPVFLTKEIIQDQIFPWLDFKSINSFVVASKENYVVFTLPVISQTIPKDACLQEFFSTCENNYALCTKALIASACAQNRTQFTTLWAYHQKEREIELREFYNYKITISPEVAMYTYAHKYKEVDKRNAKKQKQAIKYVRQRMLYLREEYSPDCQQVCQLKNTLLDNKFDAFEVFPHKKTSKVFKIICFFNDVDIVSAMLGQYILHNQAKSAHYLFKYQHRMVLELVKKGLMTIEVVDKRRKTALHYTAIPQYYPSVQYVPDSSPIHELVAAGIPVNSVDDKGRTALHYACKHMKLRAVKKLLKCTGITIDLVDNRGKTPFDYIKGSSKKNHDNKVAIKALLKAYALKQDLENS